MNIGYIATTLDGYIADTQGQVLFLDQFQNIDTGYDHFIQKIDAIVMGKNSYEAILGFNIEWPYEKQKTWIITQDHTLPKAHPSIEFWHGDLRSLLTYISAIRLDNCWLLGGGALISSAIKKGLLDQLELFVMPVLLGKGIPLFPEAKHALVTLELESLTSIGQCISHHKYRLKREKIEEDDDV